MASKAKSNRRVAAKAKAAAVAKKPIKAKTPGVKARTPGGSGTRTKPPLSGPDRKPGIPQKPRNPKNPKPGQGNSSGTQQTSLPNAAGTQTQSGSAANSQKFNYTFQTVPGSITDQYTGNLVDIANKYADNELISGSAIGALINAQATGINMGQAVQYNDAFLSSLGYYQGDMENLRTGNTMKLMGAEAGLARDLIGVQGREMRSLRETEGAQERLNIAERGNQDRLGFRVQGEEERLNIAERGNQDRLGYRVQGEEERLNIGARGVEDRRLAETQGAQERLNIGARGTEERLNIGAQGVEDRRKLQEEGTQQLRLRRDARGAIRSAGARFFG